MPVSLAKIYEEWGKDSQITLTDLTNESLNISKLHSKYIRFYTDENLILYNLLENLKTLKAQKEVFYTKGRTAETEAKGWEWPGKILKTELHYHMDTDPDIIEANLIIHEAKVIVQLLESILKMIMNRSYSIQNAIAWERFKVGG